MFVYACVCTRSPMAPVHQFVLLLYHSTQLGRPVTVLLLVHEEVHTVPHQVSFDSAKHLLVGQQHLKHR